MVDLYFDGREHFGYARDLTIVSLPDGYLQYVPQIYHNHEPGSIIEFLSLTSDAERDSWLADHNITRMD